MSDSESSSKHDKSSESVPAAAIEEKKEEV